MNPFEKHQITHLSASSLALYRNCPALWVGKNLYGWKDDVGPRAWLGTAVEAGLDMILYGHPFSAALEKAGMMFDEQAQGEITEEITKAASEIAPMLEQASLAAQNFGQPVARQFKITHWLDGIEVPVIGYVDYLYEDWLFDLKTTARLPSEPRPDHACQVAIYNAATGRKAKLLYVTPKKHAAYDVEDITDPMWTVAKSAHAVRRLLAMTDNREDAAGVFVPDFSSFYWTDPLKEAAKAVWA